MKRPLIIVSQKSPVKLGFDDLMRRVILVKPVTKPKPVKQKKISKR